MTNLPDGFWDGADQEVSELMAKDLDEWLAENPCDCEGPRCICPAGNDTTWEDAS